VACVSRAHLAPSSPAEDGSADQFSGDEAQLEQCQAELRRIGDFMANNACNVLNSQDNITVMLVALKRHATQVRVRDERGALL
jgi:hypothetical protein